MASPHQVEATNGAMQRLCGWIVLVYRACRHGQNARSFALGRTLAIDVQDMELLWLLFRLRLFVIV